MKKEIAEFKKNHILKIAGAHFDEFGYEKTQILSIAKEAEVSIGTIYAFFKNKDGLFMAYIHNRINNSYERVLSDIKELKDPVEKLKVIIKNKFSEFASCRHNIQEILVKNPMFLVQVGFGDGNPMQKVYRLIADILKELSKIKPLKSDDFIQLAYNLKSLSNGYVERWVYEEFDIISKSDEVIEYFLNGIKK